MVERSFAALRMTGGAQDDRRGAQDDKDGMIEKAVIRSLRGLRPQHVAAKPAKALQKQSDTPDIKDCLSVRQWNASGSGDIYYIIE